MRLILKKVDGGVVLSRIRDDGSVEAPRGGARIVVTFARGAAGGPPLRRTR